MQTLNKLQMAKKANNICRYIHVIIYTLVEDYFINHDYL